MKKIYFFFSILLCSLVTIAQTQMNVPVTFDDASVNYGLVGFGGAEQATVVIDPTLATNKVGKVIKTNTAELWAGASITALAGTVQSSFANAIPFTASERRMNVRVWSPHAGISLKLKVEDKNDPTKSCETDVTLSVANGWQTMEFNFNNQSAGTAAFNASTTYNKASIFFNFGVTGATAGERIYYFDDVKFGAANGGGTSTLPTLPLDFESATLNYSFTDFAGGATTKISNTQISVLNTSANVAKMIKSVGEVYGGSFITLDAPMNFSVNKTFKVKVFSPRVGAKLLLKVENASDASINFEKEATSTVANAWEDLTFDYSAISTTNQYSKVIFIFDLGTMGNGTANFTWLFDDVRLTTASGGTLTQMNVPVTFDDAMVNYGLVGFGGAEQATIVTDPTLATNKVAKVIKTNTAELWAGTSITALAGTLQTSFANAIPFTATEKRMNIRVWSPHAGIQVRLKVEDKADPTKSCETEATVTVANGWQTLEFNFANQAAGTAAMNIAFSYNKASIFFNFGVTGAVAGERIYYFDDVKFGAAVATALTQMNVPVTFDDAMVNYGLVGFGGAEQATIVTDPTLATNKVAKVIKTNTAELWAGTSITALAGTLQTSFANAIPFTATEKRMNIRVWSPHAGIQVRLKVEDKADPTKSCETEATVTVANGWQTLEFNFANQAAGTAAMNIAFSYNKASIFFNFGVTGAVAGERIYYFDDVKFGGTTIPLAPTVLSPANFCQNSTAVLSANAAVGNTLVWYTVANGGTGSITAPNIVTTATGAPFATYYVSQRNTALVEGPRAAIVVNVNATPLAPTVSSTAPTYCQNATATALSVTGAAGNTLKWYTSLTGTFTGTLIPSTTTAGLANYYVSQTNSFGCESPKATIVVLTNPTPSVPTTAPVTYCQNATANILTAIATTGNTLKWYTALTGGIASTAPTPITSTVGTTNYYVSQANGFGCESPRALLNVFVKTTSVAPNVTTPVISCINAQSTLLSAIADAGNSLLWYNVASGGTGSINFPTTVTNISGTTTYYVSQTNAGGCESDRAAINVNIIPTPMVGVISAMPYTKLFPGLATIVSVASSPTAGNVYTWYKNGILLNGQTGNSVKATIDDLGNYSLKVTNANGCVGTSNIISISDSAQEKIFIYPNASTGKFQVRYYSNTTDLKPRKMLIFDAAGRNIYTASFVMFASYTTMNVNLSFVSNGIYVIHLLDNDGKHLVTEKVLIQK